MENIVSSGAPIGANDVQQPQGSAQQVQPRRARRPRGPNKRTREALEAARAEGYRAGLEDHDRAPEMLATVILAGALLVLGAAAGALIF